MPMPQGTNQLRLIAAVTFKTAADRETPKRHRSLRQTENKSSKGLIVKRCGVNLHRIRTNRQKQLHDRIRRKSVVLLFDQTVRASRKATSTAVATL